ncbi:MAG TPA: thioredoxin TrxC [Rhizomicrobium sp.]|nr:thioredoxin TrxC [Rhizomicrobium sp.]
MNDGLIIACPNCDARNRIPRGRDPLKGKCGQCGGPLFKGVPLALTNARFDAHAAKSGLPLVVDFWAPWCGPCRSMAPTFEAAAREFEPRLRFGKVDTDAEPQLAARFGIRSIPTLIIFDHGTEKARVSGALPAAELRRWIDQAI